jgi:PhnB protein
MPPASGNCCLRKRGNDHDDQGDEGSPLGGQATGVKLHLYVEDVDDMFQREVDLGATEEMPVQDCFWDDRYGILTVPFGHRWSTATRIEDLSPGQLQKRADAFKAENPAWPTESEKGANT